MAQTPEGALFSAAKKAGLTVEEFKARRASGQKRCTKCKQWLPEESFCNDASRFDGLAAKCRECHYIRHPRVYGPSPMKGKRFPDDVRKNMGRKPGFVSEKLGRPRSAEERAAISAGVRKTALRGQSCHSFRDGKLAERRGERFSDRYKRWRYDVFLRDRFTCQNCGDDRGGNLHAHHIKSFARHPELRYDVNNGKALCNTCHKHEHRKP